MSHQQQEDCRHGPQLSKGEGIDPEMFNEEVELLAENKGTTGKESRNTKLKDAFDLFDQDGNGYICGRELGMVLRALGQNPTEENIVDFLKQADKNGDDKISCDEYMALLKGNLKDPNVVEIELREAFRIFDKNRDNTLNLAELQMALTSVGDCLTKEEALHMCKLMDTDGDGAVNVDEFVKYMCKRY